MSHIRDIRVVRVEAIIFVLPVQSLGKRAMNFIVSLVNASSVSHAMNNVDLVETNAVAGARCMVHVFPAWVVRRQWRLSIYVSISIRFLFCAKIKKVEKYIHFR